MSPTLVRLPATPPDRFPVGAIVQWHSLDFSLSLPVVHTGTSKGTDPADGGCTVVTIDYTTVYDMTPMLPRASSTEDDHVLTHLDGLILAIPSDALTAL